MKVKAIKPFTDLKEKVKRQKNDLFEVTQERFKEINSSRFGILVEKVSEPKTKKGK